MFLRTKTIESTSDYYSKTELLKQKLAEADAILIGAGAGLSASAGFSYTGRRFQQYFQDFIEKYGFQDMYSAGFVGRTLGVLEQIYLYQPVYGRTRAGL